MVPGLDLGNTRGSSGIYRLSGGTLNVLTPEIIGSSGQGAFEQTGGTHTPDSLIHGLFVGSSASYLLDGDGSTLAVNSNEYVGYNAPATFTQLGGLHSIVYHIELGRYSTGSGTYTRRYTETTVAPSGKVITLGAPPVGEPSGTTSTV